LQPELRRRDPLDDRRAFGRARPDGEPPQRGGGGLLVDEGAPKADASEGDRAVGKAQRHRGAAGAEAGCGDRASGEEAALLEKRAGVERPRRERAVGAQEPDDAPVVVDADAQRPCRARGRQAPGAAGLGREQQRKATQSRNRKTVETAATVPIPPTVITQRETTSSARTSQRVCLRRARPVNARCSVMTFAALRGSLS
jgi:hypothetical protein